MKTLTDLVDLADECPTMSLIVKVWPECVLDKTGLTNYRLVSLRVLTKPEKLQKSYLLKKVLSEGWF